MPKLLLRMGLFTLCLLLLLAVFGYLRMQAYLHAPLKVAQSGVSYELKKGSSVHTMAYDLTRLGLLDQPRWLILYSRISGLGEVVQAGDYWLPPGITPLQLLAKMERGEVRFFQFTLVEGWTLAQLWQALDQQGHLVHTLSDAAAINAEQLAVSSEHANLEGLLFPDTYRFQANSSDVDLLRQAYRRMQQVLAQEWSQRSEPLPYKNAYQALTMASIIEKETAVASERGQIAGVFVRRLQRGMRLQTDPTIIYGLGANYQGNLRRRHLKDASNPYNTYRHHGLTPTPIALAGREAINAALHPVAGDALYFVAKGDGSHYFSSSLAEHQRAVRHYQINNRRSDYQSTPPPAP